MAALNSTYNPAYDQTRRNVGRDYESLHRTSAIVDRMLSEGRISDAQHQAFYDGTLSFPEITQSYYKNTHQQENLERLQQARTEDNLETMSTGSTVRFQPLGTARSTVSHSSGSGPIQPPSRSGFGALNKLPVMSTVSRDQQDDAYDRTGRKAAQMYMRSQQLMEERMRYAEQLKQEAINRVKRKVAQKTATVAIKTARAVKLAWKFWKLFWIAFWTLVVMMIIFGIIMLIHAIFSEMCTGGIQGAVRGIASFFGNDGLDQTCRSLNF